MKDLHLREWLLSQTPVEEFDETKFTTECSNSLVALFMQIKNNLTAMELRQIKNNLHDKLKIICIGVRIWSLGILNLFAAQDFRKDPSSMVNLALHFAHLVPEDQLEGRVFSVIFTVVDQTFFK